MPRTHDDTTQDETRRGEPESEVRRDATGEEEETRTHDEEHEGGIGEGALI